jgi:hypothetical protein
MAELEDTSPEENNENATQIALREMRAELAEFKSRAQQPQQGADASVLNQLVEALNQGNKDETQVSNFEGYSPLPWPIEKDDLLAVEDQVLFLAPGSGYVIPDGIIEGKPVRVPYKKLIVFEHYHTTQKGSGKEADLVHYSKYLCKSKIVLKFLREHQMYKIKFSDKFADTDSMDSIYAQKMAEMMTSMAAYNMKELHRMCDEHGIQKHKELKTMRIHLAIKIAKEQSDGEKAESTKLLRESDLEREMIEG